MKAKRVLALVISIMLLINCVAVSAFAVETETASITVETEKTNVAAGETVDFTVYLCNSDKVSGGVFNYGLTLDIPEGLTYVSNSGKIDSSFATTTGFISPMFMEASLTSNSMGLFGVTEGYTGTKIAIMTFQCTVDIDAAGSYTVGVKDAMVTNGSSTSVPVAPSSTAVTIADASSNNPAHDQDTTQTENEEKTESGITPGANPFADISPNNWFYDAAMYVYKNGLMTGMTANTFAPNGTMTRAMVWTVLGRMAGETFGNSGSHWYSEAQSWAIEAGVSDGSNPNGAISRQELVTMLWRFVGQPEADTAGLNAYLDGSTVASWAKQSMAWAVDGGIMLGTNQKLNPGGTALRAQVAAILMRYREN